MNASCRRWNCECSDGFISQAVQEMRRTDASLRWAQAPSSVEEASC